MRKFTFLLIISISVLLAFNSCSKKKPETLIGKWTEMSYIPDVTVYTWDFVDDRTVIRRRVDGSNVDTGAYVFTTKFPNKYIELLNFDDLGQTDGKYYIDDLDDKVLTMTRVEITKDTTVDKEASPWLRKEFVKFE